MRNKETITLGELIEKIDFLIRKSKKFFPNIKFENGTSAENLYSWRGDYSQLCLCGDSTENNAEYLLNTCRNSISRIFIGYKGGEFIMDENSNIYNASYGQYEGTRNIIDLFLDENSDIVIKTAEREKSFNF